MRLAARPVGAHNRISVPFAATIRRMALTMVVLPTPGPPVITVTLDIRADSNGRRNTDFVDLPQPRVKCFCGRFPTQRLSRPGVEGGGHGGDLLGAVHAQIGAFREVLTQQSIGVLVSAALPWALGIAEVDLDAYINLQSRMLGHLGSLIPGERSA